MYKPLKQRGNCEHERCFKQKFSEQISQSRFSKWTVLAQCFSSPLYHSNSFYTTSHTDPFTHTRLILIQFYRLHRAFSSITHIHMPMKASVGNMGFSVLPKDISTSVIEHLTSLHSILNIPLRKKKHLTNTMKYE